MPKRKEPAQTSPVEQPIQSAASSPASEEKKTKQRSAPPVIFKEVYEAWQAADKKGETRKLFTFVGEEKDNFQDVYILAATQLQALKAWAQHVGVEKLPVRRLTRNELASKMADAYAMAMRNRNADPSGTFGAKVEEAAPCPGGQPPVGESGSEGPARDGSVPDQLDPDRNS